MSYIQSIASEQTWLLPYSIDELVEENNPVRVIRAYVDSLLMEDLGFVRAVVPKYALKQIEAQEFSDMELLGVTYVRQAVQLL